MKMVKDITSDPSGAALVEFSILLPILFGLCFGLIEFSRATYQQMAAEKGVKAAARYIARAPAPDPCDPTASGSGYTSAATNAVNLAQKGSVNGSGSYTLSNWTDASDVMISVSSIPNAASNGVRPWRGECENLYIVSVSTSFAYDDLGLLSALGGLINNTSLQNGLTIRASHEEIFIGD